MLLDLKVPTRVIDKGLTEAGATSDVLEAYKRIDEAGGMAIAAHLGIWAVEFDVMLSADGTPFLIHDETLERTTNGQGRVCATPDDVLLGLDAGNGEHIPTLAVAAALCRQYGLLANVEIKPATGY